MTSYRSDRLMKLMTAARQSPDFGVRLLARLPPSARTEAVRYWSLCQPPQPAAKPGLKKCGSDAATTSALGAQLQAFARTIGRVG